MFNTLRFYISWILSAVVMYAAFYVWHGLFLNDLSRISFSKVLFLFLAALVYLVISFILYRTYESRFLLKFFYPPFIRGIAAGFIVGFVLFAITTVLGISFTKNLSFTYVVADCAWQISEQMIGGVIIGLGKIIIFEPEIDLRNHH
jgi:hypothetical protein